ncbi:hypothetical protein FA13DRAFT_1710861 [Coprinellus micaceus]|uniref:Uncharacterized protein n=1 Tax=Coprinellus micaceus TaxID=71717 RepID=A0A4Y7T7N0_COPMI|nr:hypothetical protein FA13DRAFT_1710861 [Coprinellus micaceus]
MCLSPGAVSLAYRSSSAPALRNPTYLPPTIPPSSEMLRFEPPAVAPHRRPHPFKPCRYPKHYHPPFPYAQPIPLSPSHGAHPRVARVFIAQASAGMHDANGVTSRRVGHTAIEGDASWGQSPSADLSSPPPCPPGSPLCIGVLPPGPPSSYRLPGLGEGRSWGPKAEEEHNGAVGDGKVGGYVEDFPKSVLPIATVLVATRLAGLRFCGDDESVEHVGWAPFRRGCGGGVAAARRAIRVGHRGDPRDGGTKETTHKRGTNLIRDGEKRMKGGGGNVRCNEDETVEPYPTPRSTQPWQSSAPCTLALLCLLYRLLPRRGDQDPSVLSGVAPLIPLTRPRTTVPASDPEDKGYLPDSSIPS